MIKKLCYALVLVYIAATAHASDMDLAMPRPDVPNPANIEVMLNDAPAPDMPLPDPEPQTLTFCALSQNCNWTGNMTESGNNAYTGVDNFCNENGIIVAGSSCYPTVSSAIAAANPLGTACNQTNFCSLIQFKSSINPTTLGGWLNPNNVSMFDTPTKILSNATGIGLPSFWTTKLPGDTLALGGRDINIYGGGPAGFYVRRTTINTTTAATLSAGQNTNVLVGIVKESSTDLGDENLGVGTTANFDVLPGQQLLIDQGNANFENLTLRHYSSTSFAIASNVVTVQSAQSLAAGDVVYLSGLTTVNGQALNQQPLTVLAAGLSGSQFEANFTFANVTSTTDAGTVIVTASPNCPDASTWTNTNATNMCLNTANTHSGTTPIEQPPDPARFDGTTWDFRANQTPAPNDATACRMGQFRDSLPEATLYWPSKSTCAAPANFPAIPNLMGLNWFTAAYTAGGGPLPATWESLTLNAGRFQNLNQAGTSIGFIGPFMGASTNTPSASSQAIRLQTAQWAAWRNNGNTDDNAIDFNASDQFQIITKFNLGGGITITFPNATGTGDLTSNTTTTTTQVLHGSATAGVGTWSAIAAADLPAKLNGSCAPVASASSVTSSNPTINTDQKLIELSIPAGCFNTLNQPFDINSGGIYSSTAASAPVLTFKIKLCTVSACGSGTVVTLGSWITPALSATAIANATYNLVTTSVTSATGTTGNLVLKGDLTLDTGAAVSTPDVVVADSNIAVSANIDLTAALFIDFTVAQSVAGASNSYTQMLGMVR